MLSIRGHICNVEQREKALKQASSYVEGALIVGGEKSFSFLASKQILSCLAALVFVYLYDEQQQQYFLVNFVFQQTV